MKNVESTHIPKCSKIRAPSTDLIDYCSWLGKLRFIYRSLKVMVNYSAPYEDINLYRSFCRVFLIPDLNLLLQFLKNVMCQLIVGFLRGLSFWLLLLAISLEEVPEIGRIILAWAPTISLQKQHILLVFVKYYLLDMVFVLFVTQGIGLGLLFSLLHQIGQPFCLVRDFVVYVYSYFFRWIGLSQLVNCLNLGDLTYFFCLVRWGNLIFLWRFCFKLY